MLCPYCLDRSGPIPLGGSGQYGQEDIFCAKLVTWVEVGECAAQKSMKSVPQSGPALRGFHAHASRAVLTSLLKAKHHCPCSGDQKTEARLSRFSLASSCLGEFPRLSEPQFP